MTADKPRRIRRPALKAKADVEWFENAFSSVGISSRREAERVMHLHVGVLTRMLHGQQSMTVPVLKQLSVLLGVPMQIVAARAGY